MFALPDFLPSRTKPWSGVGCILRTGSLCFLSFMAATRSISAASWAQTLRRWVAQLPAVLGAFKQCLTVRHHRTSLRRLRDALCSVERKSEERFMTLHTDVDPCMHRTGSEGEHTRCVGLSPGAGWVGGGGWVLGSEENRSSIWLVLHDKVVFGFISVNAFTY